MTTATTYILKERYAPEHACPTFAELRAFLDQVGRYSPLYMITVLGLGVGLRADEMLKLSLYHLSGDCREFTYAIDKPKKGSEGGVLVVTRKYRRVLLDPWVRSELLAYLERHCRVHEGVFISPYEGQRLFPWKSTVTLEVAWHKARLKLSKRLPSVLRLERCSFRPGGQRPTYVFRFHKTRHIALSLRYARNGHNLKEAQEWIGHSRSQTTDGYVHSARQMGVDEEALSRCGLAELLGYSDTQATLFAAKAPGQKRLDLF